MDPFDERNEEAESFLNELFSQSSIQSMGEDGSQDLLAPSPRDSMPVDEQTATLPEEAVLQTDGGRGGAGAPGMIGGKYSTATEGYPTAEPAVAATVRIPMMTFNLSRGEMTN